MAGHPGNSRYQRLQHTSSGPPKVQLQLSNRKPTSQIHTGGSQLHRKLPRPRGSRKPWAGSECPHSGRRLPRHTGEGLRAWLCVQASPLPALESDDPESHPESPGPFPTGQLSQGHVGSGRCLNSSRVTRLLPPERGPIILPHCLACPLAPFPLCLPHDQPPRYALPSFPVLGQL